MLLSSSHGSSLFRLLLLAAGLVLALSGCQAQRAYNEGIAKVEQGDWITGLKKLEEARSLSPRSAKYRITYASIKDQLIRRRLEQATAAVSARQLDEGEKLYRSALELDVRNDRALSGLRDIDTLRRHAKLLQQAKGALLRGDKDGSQESLRIVLAEAPHHPEAMELKRLLADPPKPKLGTTNLAKAYQKPITIEFKDVPLKTVFEVLSRTSGLNFLFDKDLRTDQKTSIFLKNSTVEAALNMLLITNQLDQRILDQNSVLVYPRTPAKQKEYQSLVIKSFYLSNADAKGVANTLKTLLKAQDVVVDDKLNLLIIKDSPAVIKLAEKLVALHDVPEPEVMLEVEILEVKRSRLLDLGVRWPDQVSLAPLPSKSGGTLTLADLKELSRDNIGVTLGQTSINIKKQDSDANILANPRIRAQNREKAKILIGERVPNITTTSTSTGFISDTVNYVEVGLKLEVEPTVYPDDEVAINVALEVSNIVSQVQTKSGSLAFQIGTRTATSVLRLKDGENQVLAGLINDEDRQSANKLPGLGDIPLLGRLFGSQSNDASKTEIVLSITPRIIRNIPRPEADDGEFEAGTDSGIGSFGSTSLVQPSATTSISTPPVSSPPSSTPTNHVANTDSPMTNPTSQAADPYSTEARLQSGQPGPTNLPTGNLQLHWQGPTQLNVGDSFNLQLAAQSNKPIVSLPMAVSYDPRVLQVTSIVEGDFLKQGGATTRFTSRVQPDGQILMTGTRTGEGGATTFGIVATISFRAISVTEATNIQLLNTVPVGEASTSINAPVPPPHIVKITEAQ